MCGTTNTGKRITLANAIRWTTALTILSSSVYAHADIAANRCSMRLLDFGTGTNSSINISTSNPATMDIGTVTTNVAERWQTKSPYDARSGWWPSKGGDHTDPGNGYFLLMDIKSNSQGKPIYSNALTGLEIGGKYTVSLWLASAFYAASPQVDVALLDGSGALVTGVSKPVLPNATETQLDWQQVILSFTATATSQTVLIKEASDTNASGNDLALDDISLTHNCPPNVAPTAVPAISGTTQVGSVVTGTYAYADNESDVENPGGTTYKFVTSPNASIANSSEGTTVASGTPGGASAGVPYTLAGADLNMYIYYCIAPAAQTGASPGVEVCTAALGPVVDKPTPPIPPAPANVPTLGEWGVIGLSSLIAMFGILGIRRRLS